MTHSEIDQLIARQFESDLVLFADIVTILSEVLEKQFDEIREARVHADHKRVRLLTHRLYGMARLFGDERAASFSKTMEVVAAGDVEVSFDSVDWLESIFKSLLNDLRGYLVARGENSA